MAHYAFLDENNVVTEVIVGVDENELLEGKDPETWYGEFRGQVCKRTSYNTLAGVHLGEGTPFRKNYAAIGYTYNEILDGFIPPKPYNSWILDESRCIWIPPIPQPTDGNYAWDELSTSWVIRVQE